MRQSVDHFDVLLPQVTVRCSPGSGEIRLNGTTMVHCPAGKLLWFRRMEMQLATHDTNIEGKAEPLFYGLGVRHPAGKSYVRIYPDGKVKLNADQ